MKKKSHLFGPLDKDTVVISLTKQDFFYSINEMNEKCTWHHKYVFDPITHFNKIETEHFCKTMIIKVKCLTDANADTKHWIDLIKNNVAPITDSKTP